MVDDEEAFFINDSNYPCIFKIGNKFYDYTPFRLARNVWPAVNDYNIEDITQPIVLPRTYNFTWCMPMSAVSNASDYECNGDYFAVGSEVQNFECEPYSGADEKTDISAVTIENEVTYKNSSDVEVTELLPGVALQYTGGNTCEATGESMTFTINIYCNNDLAYDDTRYDYVTQGDECNPSVTIVSPQGCDVFSNSYLWYYLGQAEPYFGFIAIGVGLMVCFFGLKLVKPSICVAGFLTCTLASCLFFYAVYISSLDDTEAFWYFLGGGALAGILVGLLLARFVIVGAAILAGWGGFTLGLILNEAFLYKFELVWLFWVSVIACALIAAILTFKLFKPAMILSTSFLGAYLLVRGVGVYAPGYVNEFTIIQMLKDGLIDEIDPIYWAYVGGFVLLTIIGAAWQFRQNKKMTNKHPYMNK